MSLTSSGLGKGFPLVVILSDLRSGEDETEVGAVEMGVSRGVEVVETMVA